MKTYSYASRLFGIRRAMPKSMKLAGRYFGQILFFSFLIMVVLLQTYCGPRIMPQDSCGFAQNSLGQRISWKKTLPVKLYFDPNFPSDMRNEVYAAINTWESAAGRKLFQVLGNSSNPQAHDNTNVLYWMGSWNNSTDATTNEQASTLAWWADNQMVENDVLVNNSGSLFSLSTNPTPSTKQIDMQSLMVHELGHVLGLKHIDSEPSVMNKSLEYSQIRRTLYPIDVADLKCEY